MAGLGEDFWLGASIVVLIGAGALFVLKKIRLRRARNWPTEAGRVESSVVKLESSGAPPNVSSQYVAAVKYSYSVQSAVYFGSLQRSFVLKGSADKWIGKYPAGFAVIIRYNPKNAKDSVLLERDQAGVA